MSNVQISCPAEQRPIRALLELYGELLGMEPINIGYPKLVHADGRLPEIGIETHDNDPPPRWPDPEHPQQLHLDIEVGDLDAAEDVATRTGAIRLRDNGEYRVFADPVGHPFCLYENRSSPPVPGRLRRIVFDCFSPRALARFYEELLDMRTRVLDTPELVMIAYRGSNEDGGPLLAFQHAQFPAARWPDPAYPEQLHLDLTIDDEEAPARAEELGAIRLRIDERPDALVYADPASHPFCLGVGPRGPSGPGQVEVFAAMYPQG